ncbi:hypothetical protein AAG565_06280 [Fontimonas sp. SYSU GA230001]|uniref:hypothetical protein n=1 Tax=Fontimonas sp. SYSU GA230001 TaxID=3142450 RepID=UPI0032B36512
MLSTPNGPALERALAGLEFMVSIDCYLNETTKHAHLILPPTTGVAAFNGLPVQVCRLPTRVHADEGSTMTPA